MEIITFANPHIGVERLLSTCPTITVLGEATTNNGIIDKVLASLQFLEQQEPNEIVLFVDAYDVFILRQPVLDHIGIMFNAEKALWTPDLNEMKDVFPNYSSEWKYLNSGVYGGKVRELLPFVRLWAFMLTHRSPSVDDQSAANILFAASHIITSIDYRCEVFQCYSHIAEDDYYYEPGSLVNRKTGTKPSVIHANGKTDVKKLMYVVETSFDWLANNWKDTVAFHEKNKANFDWMLVNGSPDILKLAEIRKWVRDYVWGFGEDCFAALWYMLVKSVEAQKCLEVGVFKGQTLAYMAASGVNDIVGVGLFERGGNIPDWDFSEQDTYRIFDEFGLDKKVLNLIKGDSLDPKTVEKARGVYDIVYIDGDHTFEGAYSDLCNYAPMVRSGGLLVIDDCATDTQVPIGWFGGIVTVTQALEKYMSEHLHEWQFSFNLVHIKVYRRR